MKRYHYEDNARTFTTGVFDMTYDVTDINIKSPARVGVPLATAGVCIVVNLAVITLLFMRRSPKKFTSDQRVSSCICFGFVMIDPWS